MRLLIISHTEHYIHQGQVFGWGATVREIDELASLFESIAHLAFLYPGQPPSSALPYQSSNVHLIPVPPAGGESLWDKLRILTLFPLYLRTLLREFPSADVVHVRAPANISLLAMVLLAFLRNPRLRWIKYAGNWQPARRESLSYSFQRWWLRNGFARARVTINGEWPRQPAHVHSFFNPCFTEQERLEAAELAVLKQLEVPLRMLFVGRVETAKGIGTVLRVLSRLCSEGFHATLDVVGDGPERPVFERMATGLGLQDSVHFHGWVPRTRLGPLYSVAHFILLPSTASEGWPKVLSEAMAYGAVPLAGDVSSIGQSLCRFGAGRALPPNDLDGFVQAIKAYVKDPAAWKQESLRGVSAASHFTYAAYLNAVRDLLELPLRNPNPIP